MTTPQFMPAGFYVEKRDTKRKKMRLVSFFGKQGHFQISKNGREVMLIGIEAMEHVDPPADYLEWNKVYEKPEVRTVTDIAQDALKNFSEMTMRMQVLAHSYESIWPNEEEMFTELGKYTKRNRELEKELERIYSIA